MHSCVTNRINNNPITKRNVGMAIDMLGRSLYLAKGKTTRTQPDTIDPKQQIVEVLPHVMKYYSNVEVSVDIIHFNDIPFLMSISYNIYYGTSLTLITLLV